MPSDLPNLANAIPIACAFCDAKHHVMPAALPGKLAQLERDGWQIEQGYAVCPSCPLVERMRATLEQIEEKKRGGLRVIDGGKKEGAGR